MLHSLAPLMTVKKPQMRSNLTHIAAVFDEKLKDS